MAFHVPRTAGLAAILVLSGAAFARSGADGQSAAIPATRAFFEVLLSHSIVWGFDRFVIDESYARIDGGTMRRNLGSEWVWDQNTFATNHVGHPYQGSTFYTVARTQGLGIVPSAALTAFGSVSWEYLMETEPPSKNDFVATTLGGVSFGEILYRLSAEIQKKPSSTRRGLGAVVSPAYGLNRALGWIEESPGDHQHIDGIFDFGIGTSYGGAEIAGNVSGGPRRLSTSGGARLLLRYGSPFSERYVKPFDHFNLSYAGFRMLGQSMHVALTDGLLARKIWKPGRNRLMTGLWLHYDIIYNDWINLGAHSLGSGLVWSRRSPGGVVFHASLRPSWVVLGSSDFLYAKLLGDRLNARMNRTGEVRTYQLSTGENVKAVAGLGCGKWHFMLNYNFYGLHTMPGSQPYAGSKGYDIVGMGGVRIGYSFAPEWGVSAEQFVYHKESWFKSNWPGYSEIILRNQLMISRYF